MNRARNALRLCGLLALLMPALLAATPPPPPPRAVLNGPDNLCEAHFGLRLVRGEVARQYMSEYWVVSGPGLELGIRTDLPMIEGPASSVTIVGLGAGERQRVREYPGNIYHGWIYAFPMAGGATLRIASFQFVGTGADRALLGRVLIGAARDALCAPRS